MPAKLTVTPGTLILVTNEDPVAHTLTAGPGSTPFGAFDTGPIATGAHTSFRAPRRAGSYSYYCSIHNFMTWDPHRLGFDLSARAKPPPCATSSTIDNSSPNQDQREDQMDVEEPGARVAPRAIT